MAARAGSIGLVLAVSFMGIGALAATPNGSGLLGSEQFKPSPEQPMGWRGDGTGRYPGATPPVMWEKKADGSSKGIAWMTPLPNIGVSSPIVVGDKIYLTSEVADLVCIDKAGGKILWIRSNAEFEGLSDAERAAEPAIASTLAPLMPQLAAANAEVVEILNAQLATGPVDAAGKPDAAIARKKDAAMNNKKAIEKKILDAQTAIDKKKFGRYWGQAVFGFSGPTAISDGKHVCAFFTTGVTACYDLEGSRKWIARGAGGGSEHGNFASPVMCDGKVVVWANEMRAYDVATGALAWSHTAKAFNTYGSMVRFRSGGEWVACFQWGFFTRVSDGQPVWDQGAFGDSVTTPIVEGNAILAMAGYPKFNEKNKGLKVFKIPPNTRTGKVALAYDLKLEWADDEIPADKQKAPFDRGYVASPLMVDGLVYQVTQGGGLSVNDATTGELVYKKVLALKPRTHYWDWSGCSASPTAAGKYVYLMDNQGTTLVIEPGRAYKEVGRNVIEELRNGKDQAQTNANPVFEGSRMYYRTPGYLYCVGK